MKRQVKKWTLSVMLSVMMFWLTTSQVEAAVGSSYQSKTIELRTSSALTRYYGANTYSASTPSLTALWDRYDQYHVGYKYSGSDGNYIVIQRYNSKLELQATVSIKLELPLFGNFTTDGKYYYVVTAQNNPGSDDMVATCTAKYTLLGKKMGCCELTGYESNPYATWGEAGDYWGTKYPFDAGSCQLAIQGNILSCNYGREMFSGHQSNFVFWVDTETMTKKNSNSIIYCSHSFDQDVVATSDGGFLYANHGDAYDRGFLLTRINSSLSSWEELLSFTFREGASRSYGYNETYAQLGGLIEINDGYVLCASSEKTLSLAEGASGYMIPNEARNLFVQIIKKDFTSNGGANNYVVAGETRRSVGTHPSNPSTKLWLPSAGVTDYGVIWLTDYANDYYVNNPKIIAIGENVFAVLWEKAPYQRYSNPPVETYYMVLNSRGQVLQPATLIPNTGLPGNSDVDYHNGAVYWVTADGSQQKINELKLTYNKEELRVVTQPVSQTVTEGKKATFNVVAAGDGLTYQWQYSQDNGATWKNSGAASGVTASYVLEAKESRNGYLIRCIIKDAYGKTVTSNAVKLTVTLPGPVITTQPKAVTATEGTNATFKIVATGSGLSYQWQYSQDGGTTWNNSGAASGVTASYVLGAKASRNGYLIRCKVKDSSGKTVTSNAVKLTVTSAGPVITTQPKAVTATEGTNATFKIVATGSNLTYQWQYSQDNGTTWKNSGAASGVTATYVLGAKASRNGYLIRCKVKDSSGITKTSSAVKLTVTSAGPVITTQPKAVTATEGTNATFKIVATGSNLTYQWQYSQDGGTTWKNSGAASGVTATYVLGAKASRNGYLIRCKVNDASGKTVTSNEVKLTVKNSANLEITTLPVE